MALGATATVVLTARALADTPNTDLVNRAWAGKTAWADHGHRPLKIEREISRAW